MDPTSEEDLLDKPVERLQFAYENWVFTVTKYHILRSTCERGQGKECKSDALLCQLLILELCSFHLPCVGLNIFDQGERWSPRAHSNNSIENRANDHYNQVCTYHSHLAALPQWPEMTFADNMFRIERKDDQKSIEFNALDALKLVNATTPDDSVKVAASKVWSEARQDCEHLSKMIKPFDWTFTTEYMGNIQGFQLETTDECINLDKLRVHEPILFFQEVPLFEDELADNGCSSLTLKFRCMKSGFFALLRFYLRVDHVLVRVLDTRFYYEAGKRYILRERSRREKLCSEMSAEEKENCFDSNMIWQMLPVLSQFSDKLYF